MFFPHWGFSHLLRDVTQIGRIIFKIRNSKKNIENDPARMTSYDYGILSLRYVLDFLFILQAFP